MGIKKLCAKAREESSMNLTIQFDERPDPAARLRVVGVGGAGCNAVSRMVEAGLAGVEFIGLNTDVQALAQCKAPVRLQIGRMTTKGLGAGADPEVGRRAIEESREAVAEALTDSDLVFVTAGMGGGTGTGAGPIVAEIAKDLGALTVAIVTKPFDFEGLKRMRRAEEGIAEFKDRVDTLIVVPNQRLLEIVPKDTPLTEAFRLADEVLLNATKGISDLIMVPGLINLDFADVRTVMTEAGDALMGTGVASGDDRAVAAARAAISSPLVGETSILGAAGLLVNVTGPPNLSLHEVSTAATIIRDAAGPDANIIFGAVLNPKMKNEVRVTVIATGFGRHARPKPEPPEAMWQAKLPSSLEPSEIPAFARKIVAEEPVNGNNGFEEAEQAEEMVFENERDEPAYLRKRRRLF
ncbi:MAG: cell division protein FtsZ [candidate division KSB1 bacterium]|nr:cell division protein FtsZ [candidate division KSB1 bacterium]MDZ7294462.1 cell division protein FtsZ [candidate division KSB1 bacterium]MDZ7386235.1 cell division protein FtsZ [candidate division KSB1 bacterium]MDZ7393634.1 cell division protein FtsZ [candidate division KSB1 bacterium]